MSYHLEKEEKLVCGETAILELKESTYSVTFQ